jgi:hypothetical protein
MSATERQTDLFAGELWTVLYQAFPSINFNASDPVSINQALQNYLQINYPENFNDWIISSEFVAIIDLLSWLAGTLAFKTDIAARENFLDTAEAKESVLRLARFLSYNPSRCQTASGILKITAVSTNNDVYDSFGNDLINTTINWNDPNNANWFEQFTYVMNDAFVTTNPFGVPLSQGTVSSIATQLYRVNGLTSNDTLGFSSTVSGVAMDFEVCDGDFLSGGTLFERDPNPNVNAFQLYYLNDNNGYSSSRTGFFLLFKQGSTQSQTFNISIPIENQLLSIAVQNINQTDVWVDTVDDSGNVLIDWTMVPAIFNSNVTYNSIPINQRNIFSVITGTNDQITVRFSDGRFGNAPSGNVKVAYRVSNGLSYQIKAQEINNVQLPVQYINSVTGATQTLTITFGLFEAVSNSAASETIESIRQRAPRVYGTQGRMVSGEDYNAFPLSTNLAVKINAVNRVYSGQSRYIDLHDPTGTYQDLSIFAEDGILFREARDSYFEIPSSLNQTNSQIISGYIQPVITQYTISNVIRDVLLQNTNYVTSTFPTLQWSGGMIDVSPQGLIWTTSNANLFQTTGWFSQTQNLIQPGSIVQFNIAGVPTWVAVIDIQPPINTVPLTDAAGPVTLGQEVPSGSLVLAILPSATVQPSAVLTTVLTQMNLKLSYSLWYDYSNGNSTNGPVWVMNAPASDFGTPEPALVGTQLQIMNVNYIGGIWRITAQGLNYVFESVSDVEWFFNGNTALAAATGEADLDLIRVMRINRNLNDVRGYAFSKDYYFTQDRMWSYPDGTEEARRCVVLLNDSTGDGYPDAPDTLYAVMSSIEQNNYLFWSNAANPPYDLPLYTVVIYDTNTLLQADSTQVIGTVGFQVTSTETFLSDETFWVYNGTIWQQDLNAVYRMERGRGPNVGASWVTRDGVLVPSGDELVFQWKHYAESDHRIDPCTTNIIDIFVLTYSYDSAIRQWITAGAVVANMPTAPSELDLSIAFSALSQYQMFSDTIIWRPVSYKLLFGNGADPELMAQFKVVRLVNATISDGQIQSGVITAINTFFAVSNWDFGETFYYTELAAYIHQQMVGMISSVVLVPLAADSAFGNNFETSCDPDEIFISTATVSNVTIITSNTATNLRINASPLGS